MKFISVVFVALIISGCSAHMEKIAYEGAGFELLNAEPLVESVIVSDERGTDGDWLGAIRGGYGNRLKTLRTEEPTSRVVEKMYRDALVKSNLLSLSVGAPLALKVVIVKFDCSYAFNKEAHANVNVSLVDNATSFIIFYKSYKTDEVEPGVSAGIFGDVDALRNTAETAMNKVIDKMLSDEEFIDALLYSSKDTAIERLSKTNED
jgi:hypothetical protein